MKLILTFSLGLALAAPALAQEAPPRDIAARVEVLTVSTMTLSDEQFLTGQAGTPVTIAGVLRIPRGTGRLPLVVYLPPSSGFQGGDIDLWDRQFAEMGIATFALDEFAARGITDLVLDQSRFGRLNAILDLYRSLAVLADHPRIDPARIVVMGFSRGGSASLYAGVTRFDRMWNTGGVHPAAFIALYPTCATTYLNDTDVIDRPIRAFSGIPDDNAEIGPCREYIGRLRAKGRDAMLTEFPDTWHSYDNPLYPIAPTMVANGQRTHCALAERSTGTIINTATAKPFTFSDACVGRGFHIAFSATATRATQSSVKDLLRGAFHLN